MRTSKGLKLGVVAAGDEEWRLPQTLNFTTPKLGRSGVVGGEEWGEVGGELRMGWGGRGRMGSDGWGETGGVGWDGWGSTGGVGLDGWSGMGGLGQVGWD